MADKEIMSGEVLPDGRLRLTTGKISAAKHVSAEELLKTIRGKLGGASTRTKRHSNPALTSTVKDTHHHHE